MQAAVASTLRRPSSRYDCWQPPRVFLHWMKGECRVGPRVAPAPLLLATRSGSELSRDARRDRCAATAGASASAADVQAAAPIMKEAACGARPLRARRAMRTR